MLRGVNGGGFSSAVLGLGMLRYILESGFLAKCFIADFCSVLCLFKGAGLTLCGGALVDRQDFDGHEEFMGKMSLKS